MEKAGSAHAHTPSKTRQFKHVISALLFAVLVFASLAAIRVGKATSPNIFVSPGSKSVQVGEQFSIDIGIDYVEDLYGYEIRLSFDNTILNATAIDYRDFLNTPTFIFSQGVNNVAGYATLAITSTLPATPTTGGSPPPLATIYFESINAGTSSLNFTKTVLANIDGFAIPHQSTGGQVQSGVQPAHWWNDNWRYRQRITFNNTQISEDLDNFSIPIIFDAIQFKFWSHVKNDGSDMRFVDSDDTTELYFEIEHFNFTGNSMLVWVKVPQIDAGSNTDHIWLYYGNASASFSSYYSSAQTWDNNFVLVHHLNETSGNHLDSTSNRNNATTTSVTQQGAPIGKLDGADQFDGLDDVVLIPDSTSLNLIGNLTLEVWIKLDQGTQESYAKVITKAKDGSYPYQIDLNHNEGSNILHTSIARTGDILHSSLNSSFILTADIWYYVVAVFNNKTGHHYLYINGIQDASNNYGGTTLALNDHDVSFGARSSTQMRLEGVIDETRISKVPRNGEWIEACYQYQVDRFKLIYGDEEAAHTPLVSNPSPSDGSTNVPSSLSSLSFGIRDPDGDLMNYSVATFPDIGSDSAINVLNGTYTVAVSGLQHSTSYAWRVNITDGTNWTNETYSFITAALEPDIAILNVQPAQPCVFKHHGLNVSATVANVGETVENVNVTLYISEISGWHLISVDGRLRWFSDGRIAEKGVGENFWETVLATVVTVPSPDPLLSFRTRYELENLYDYGFVQISTDAGATWTSLQNNYTTFDQMPLTEPEIAANLPGLTGSSEGWPDWMTMTFNLSDYVGQTVLLGFRYMTDTVILGQGWYIDNVTLNALTISNQAFQPLTSLPRIPLYTLTVTDLAPSTQTVIIFIWNTSTTSAGLYSISCMAHTLEEEIHVQDNFFLDGLVEVKRNPDLDDDLDVDIFDIVIMVGAYGSEEGEPRWNQRADLIEDKAINIFDVVAIVVYYGETLTGGCP